MAMNNQEKYKLQMFNELAQLMKGLANDKRLMILHYLAQAPKTVEEIAQATGMSTANTSRHLKQLRYSHLVKSVKDKNYIIYSLANQQIRNLINDAVKISDEEVSEFTAAQRLADSEHGVKTISLSRIKNQQPNYFWIDARPVDEYKQGHFTLAHNIPFNEIQSHLNELPKNKPIIVYCRGRLCPITNQVTQELNKNGYEAYSFNDDWQLLEEA